MRHTFITQRGRYAPQVEFVERKGLGHPDTLCDRLAEDLARHLAERYLAHTGRVQHFNVDKAVLAAGSVEVGFGGGYHTKPSRLVLVGKADLRDERWAPDPEELALEYHRRLLELLPDATPEAFEVEIWLNQSSGDLQTVIQEGHASPVPLANDTSFAAVSLPRSPLEAIVHEVEVHLNDDAYRAAVPVGRDIKVMGARIDEAVTITVAAPIMAAAVRNRAEYEEAVTAVHDTVAGLVAEEFGHGSTVQVNQADTGRSQYLTLTGTSAEAGDDGQVGRGNRFGGLITPYRPMSLEAAAGKNPAAHVGKTYHAFGQDIAERIIAETPATEATIRMLSAIGHPVTEPQVVHVELTGTVPEPTVEEIVTSCLANWQGVRDRLIRGEYELF